MRQRAPSTIPQSAYCILLLFLSSCSVFAVNPTPTPVPTSTTQPTDTPAAPPTETAAPTPVPAPARATYTLDTTIDTAAHTVSVNETIVYPNHTGQALTKLVLAAVPNLWADCFTILSLSVDGAPAPDFNLNGQRLDVNLPAPLGPEFTATLSIQYTLALPIAVQEDPNVSRPRIFGYNPLQLNLTNWYPFVVPFINGEWALHETWYYGEHLVYDAVDYIVDLRFSDPANPPVVAASGVPEVNTDFTRYTLTAGRAFAISASHEYKVATLQVGDVTISSYYPPFYDWAGEGTLQASAQAIQIYSQRYGPYPHKTLAIVMGDFNDGMEFSAFYFHSRAMYNLYDGKQTNLAIAVAVHETAHQWWFEQVANDQATQPWLDESLSTYSERVFYENISPSAVTWWWAYRVDIYQPQGFVDTPIYDGQGSQTYINAVYFRGAHFLEDLRIRIGDEAFFAFLQDYLKLNNGKIAVAGDFFSALREHTRTDFSDLVRQYFQNVY
jgi:aminopeptidase N